MKLKKFGINDVNISTDIWPVGKYKLNIDNQEVKLTIQDNLELVVNNVNSIINELKINDARKKYGYDK